MFGRYRDTVGVQKVDRLSEATMTLPVDDARIKRTMTDEEIVAAVKQKHTFAAAAKLAGCSRERVRQICEPFGVKSDYVRQVRHAAKMRAQDRKAAKRREQRRREHAYRKRLNLLKDLWKRNWALDDMAKHVLMTPHALKSLIQRVRKIDPRAFPQRKPRGDT